MSQFSAPPPPPPLPYNPPTAPGPMALPPARSSWPMVIGIIAIVLGIVGVLCHVVGMLGPILQRRFAEMIPASEKAGLEVHLGWANWTMTIEAFATLLAVFGIVSGIGVAQRRAWSIKAIYPWACFSIVQIAAAAFLQYHIMSEAHAAMMTLPDVASMPASAQMAMKGGMLIGPCVWIICFCTFPAFVLFWFNRSVIRAETANWAGAAPRSFVGNS